MWLVLAGLAFLWIIQSMRTESFLDVALPAEWCVYGPVPCSIQPAPVSDMLPATPSPASIVLGNQAYPRLTARPDKGVINLAKVFSGGDVANARRTGDWAYLTGIIHCEKSGTVLIGTGADWWMQWLIDGKPVFDTLGTGNQSNDYSLFNHVFRVRLEKGDHAVCVLVKSGSAGWKFVAGSGSKHMKQLAEIEKRQGSAVRDAKLAETKLLADAGANSHMKLVIFGSSVASGAGAEDSHGWAYRLQRVLEKRNWTVVNKSVGGDTTTKLLARFNRDLLTEKPDAVIIALSLANEGLASSPTEAYARYVRNLRKLVQLCRKHGILPVISSCYPNNAYTQIHYDFIRRFNAELDTWPVASIDFLGAVDAGDGHWQADCWKDGAHPNDRGHEEMFYSISPSLFDSLIDPDCAFPILGTSWLQTVRDPAVNTAPLKCHVDEPMHSFSLAVSMMVPDISGDATVVLSVEGNEITLEEGRFVYKAAGGDRIQSMVKVVSNRPTHLALTHSYINHQTGFWVDGLLAGTVSQQITPVDIYLGGSCTTAGRDALYQAFMLYRSCLGGGQVRALAQGRVLRSSLELYAPLTDQLLVAGLPLANSAQTETKLVLVNHQCRSKAYP